MDVYTISEAAEQFDDLVRRAEAGESVELSREGRIVARLEPAPTDELPGRKQAP